jgi:MULE transposase domain
MKGLTESQLAAAMDSMKTFWVKSNNVIRCQQCSNQDNHKMRYRLLSCRSALCVDYGGCEWCCKINTCLETNLSEVFENGTHSTVERSPPRKKLTLVQKRFVRMKAAEHVRPSRILIELSQDPTESVDTMPTLAQVQRASYHYRNSAMMEAPTTEQVNALISQRRYFPDVDSSTGFVFGYKKNYEGNPDIGNGSDENPFLLGITSKSLLAKLQMCNEHTLHVDATFKLNVYGYPVIVVGVSDRNRTFHVISFFITSQLKAVNYEESLGSLFDLYDSLIGRPLEICRVMSDADDALFNAFDVLTLKRGMTRPTHLMCFFHVAMNVKKHSVKLSKQNRKLVKDFMYQLHFSEDDQ